MKEFKLILCLLIIIAHQGHSQQQGDGTYNPEVTHPVYGKGMGPVVFIDEAHVNFHKKNGRYKTFATALENDGYVVDSSIEIFTNEQLTKCKILVIANALHPSNEQEWSLPNPSAFTDAEIEAVNSWVNSGGSLFLIADHMPFPGAAEKMAATFGFKFINGYALKDHGNDIFKLGKGLVESEITDGRNKEEKITSLQSFTGQAFKIPEQAQPIIVLSSKYTIKMPETAWHFTSDTPTMSGENLVQGAYMDYGKGRIVVFGEAAMFTAQSSGKHKAGMNVKSAAQNLQFLLNVVHWLDGIIE